MFILLLSSMQGSTVNGQQDDPRRQGYWFVGFGTGAAWQQADIKPSLGWGFDFNFGSNIFYKKTSPLSLDWRFNSLFAFSNSNDHIPTYISPNSGHPLAAPSPWNNNWFDNTPITSTNNYAGKNVYLNNQTFMINLGIDFRLNFENLRRKSNILLAVYGGPSLGVFSTGADHAEFIDDLYDYDLINPNRSRGEILSDLSRMRDGHEDTDLVGLKAGYMTNLGLELGYWFTPYFSMGLGHKWTFTHRDNFDGEFSQVRKHNDIHHYTNLFFRWSFGQGSATTTRVREKAVINMVSHTCGSTINTNAATFRANVTNVTSSSQVKVYVNGKLSNNYFYSKSSNQVVFNATLRGGENDIVIEADNGSHKTTYSCVIISQQQNNTVVNPPIQSNQPSISITYPLNNSTVQNCNTKVIVNPTNAQVVYLVVNGVRINRENNVGPNEYNVSLNKGRNQIVAHAEYGINRVQETIVVYCNEPETVVPPIQNVPQPVITKKYPTVRFTLPVGNPFTTTNAIVDLTAVTTNINFQSQVQVNVNGQNYTNFNFSFVNNRVDINRVTLNPGQNTISIHVVNDDGQASDSKIIYYNQPAPPVVQPPVVQGPPPTVRFTDPNVSPYTVDANSINLVAASTNVRRREDITVYVNNRLHNSVSFTNNNINIRSVNLAEGANTIQVQVVNNYGQASDEQVVIYVPRRIVPPPPPPAPPVQVVKNPPTVQFTAPQGNPYTNATNVVTLVAATTNINNQNQVSVTVNGSNFNNFFFNAARNTVTINGVNLIEGNNIVAINVRNNDGQASDSKTIVYNAPRPVTPPTVQFTAPQGNPYTSTSNTTTLTATTRNITAQNQIVININGRNHTNFTFNATRNTVSINGVTLAEGNNNVVINVQNQDGQASDSKTIVYNAPRPVTPPTVQFTVPQGNPYTSADNTVTLVAATTNITAVNQITVRLNNATYTNFTFNAANNTVTLSNVALQQGENNFAISVQNQDGQASDSKAVWYKVPRPTIRITTPSANPHNIQTTTQTIVATTTNVLSASEINFTVNGNPITNFTFANNTITATNVSLSEGNNNVVIAVNNGRVSASTVINVTLPRPVAPAPIISNMNATQRQSRASISVQVSAKIQHHHTQDGIEFYANDQRVSNFSLQNGDFYAENVPFTEGLNVYKIVINGEGGRATMSCVLNQNAGTTDDDNNTPPSRGDSGLITSPPSNNTSGGRGGNTTEPSPAPSPTPAPSTRPNVVTPTPAPSTRPNVVTPAPTPSPAPSTRPNTTINNNRVTPSAPSNKTTTQPNRTTVAPTPQATVPSKGNKMGATPKKEETPAKGNKIGATPKKEEAPAKGSKMGAIPKKEEAPANNTTPEANTPNKANNLKGDMRNRN